MRMFWEGRFERMGVGNVPGTILTVRDEHRAALPDQCFDGMPFGREEFFTQVFFGPSELPDWRQWSSETVANRDPGGAKFRLNYLQNPSPAMLQEGYFTIKDCPFERYPYPSSAYFHCLGFPLEMLARFFTERLRERPPFLIKAQARHAGAHKVPSDKPGRRRYAFDEAELESWFLKLIHRFVAEGRTISADDAHRLAKIGFHDRVPRHLIRRLHRELAPEDWKQQGRRPTR